MNPLDLTAHKLSVSIPISNEMADDIRARGNIFDALEAEQRRWMALTPQQRADEYAARQRAAAEREATERAEAGRRQLAAMGRVDPTLRPVLTLHAPVYMNGRMICEGCDFIPNYEGESPDWPCRTWELAAGE